MRLRPPGPTLFPYTTLFRSRRARVHSRSQVRRAGSAGEGAEPARERIWPAREADGRARGGAEEAHWRGTRSEEHTSESSHSQISYAVFCLKKKIYVTSNAKS